MSCPVGCGVEPQRKTNFMNKNVAPESRWWKRYRMLCSISSNAETVIVYIYMQVFLCTKYVSAGLYLSDVS